MRETVAADAAETEVADDPGKTGQAAGGWTRTAMAAVVVIEVVVETLAETGATEIGQEAETGSAAGPGTGEGLAAGATTGGGDSHGNAQHISSDVDLLQKKMFLSQHENVYFCGIFTRKNIK